MINLLAESRVKNEYGVYETTVTSTPAYAQVNSVTRSEFFEGGRNGLNPEFMFSMNFGNYHGERILEYNGATYSVYRTYQGRTDTIELYVERKGGTNGADS